MKEKRYFYDGQLEIGKSVTLEGDEFHHLANVLRARVGDKIILINGDGNFYNSTVTSISKKSAQILVNNSLPSDSEPKINLTLFQALAKGDKLSLITQKISEIGANNLVLFESEFCDIKTNTSKAERLENIAISAAKQCGRASILKIDGPILLKQIASMINSFDAFFVAYENEDNHTLVDSINKLNINTNNIAIVIGPEGGFSDKEITLLKESGADIVSLGKRILRTETAAIATCAVIVSLLDK